MGIRVEHLSRQRVRLLESFALVIDGMIWETRAGLISDAGSLPSLTWWAMGHPFAYLAEYLWHDQMCRDASHGLTINRVHWLFYRALVMRVRRDFAVKPKRGPRYRRRVAAWYWNRAWRHVHAVLTYAAVMVGKRQFSPFSVS